MISTLHKTTTGPWASCSLTITKPDLVLHTLAVVGILLHSLSASPTSCRIHRRGSLILPPLDRASSTFFPLSLPASTNAPPALSSDSRPSWPTTHHPTSVQSPTGIIPPTSSSPRRLCNHGGPRPGHRRSLPQDRARKGAYQCRFPHATVHQQRRGASTCRQQHPR